MTTLLDAAKAVCWFNWDDNDKDAVEAIQALRAAIEAEQANPPQPAKRVTMPKLLSTQELSEIIARCEVCKHPVRLGDRHGKDYFHGPDSVYLCHACYAQETKPLAPAKPEPFCWASLNHRSPPFLCIAKEKEWLDDVEPFPLYRHPPAADAEDLRERLRIYTDAEKNLCVRPGESPISETREWDRYSRDKLLQVVKAQCLAGRKLDQENIALRAAKEAK